MNLIVLAPLLGVAVYLIARGDLMAARGQGQGRATDGNVPARPRMTSVSSDMARPQVLKERGILTDEDYRRAKQKTLA